MKKTKTKKVVSKPIKVKFYTKESEPVFFKATKNVLKKTKKVKKLIKKKVWWVRRGEEGFLTSQLWMNYQNAKLKTAGMNLGEKIKNWHVVPCEIHYKF